MKTQAIQAILRPSILASAAGLAGLLFTGCSSLQPQFDANGIPAARYRVGGGYEIDYRAPATGTAVVVEDTSHRVWVTQSVDELESFTFRISADDPDLHERLGQNASEAKFSLYFLPAKSKLQNEEDD